MSGQLRTSISYAQEFSALTGNRKSRGDGQVVTVAGTGWCWELLAINLHPGGQGVFGRSLLIEARAESGSNLGVRAALFRDSTALPHGGRV